MRSTLILCIIAWVASAQAPSPQVPPARPAPSQAAIGLCEAFQTSGKWTAVVPVAEKTAADRVNAFIAARRLVRFDPDVRLAEYQKIVTAQVLDPGQVQAAITAYEKLVTNIPDTEACLAAEAQADLAALRLVSRSATEQAAQSYLDEAAALAASGSYKQAVEIIDLAKDFDTKVSPATAALIHDRRAEYKRLERERPPSAWKNLRTTLAGLAPILWLVVLLLVWALIMWLAPPRKSIFVQIADLSAATPGQPSPVFTQELQNLLNVAVPGGARGARLDFTNDIDGSAFANLRLGLTPDTIASAVDLKLPVGQATINLGELVKNLTKLMKRRYSLYVTGSILKRSDEKYQVTALALNRFGRPERGLHWAATCDTVHQAVVDIASQVLVSMQPNNWISPDWRSYRDSRLGLDALRRSVESAERREHLMEAREAFQSAVRHDVSNWFARFYLAVTQRKLGLNEIAAHNLIVVGSTYAGSPAMKVLMEKKQPEFLRIVMYNLAICLLKTQDEEAQEKGLAILDAL